MCLLDTVSRYEIDPLQSEFIPLLRRVSMSGILSLTVFAAREAKTRFSSGHEQHYPARGKSAIL